MNMLRSRSSGILVHISSLPSENGIGDLGPDAYRWIDFLAEGRQRFWMVLPVNPISSAGFNSPYQAVSAFAGNPLFISPVLLLEEGLLAKEDLAASPRFAAGKVDYPEVYRDKKRLLEAAARRFFAAGPPREFEEFCERHSYWLEDYAAFAALRERFPDTNWPLWEPGLRDRRKSDVEAQTAALGDSIRQTRFNQYCFEKQWFKLKSYANRSGVQIIGDLPFYVGYDSADVWGHPELFKLDPSKQREYVAGVPPDAFSDTGQLWGNPVYQWEEHAKTGYGWWISRLGRTFDLFDLVRVDHFRGFAGYWEVPGGSKDAIGGKWVDSPGAELFRTVLKYHPFPPLIAEDLGTITPDVRELINTFGFPRMKVLLFAFDGDTADNPYSIHNHEPDAVLFTGTHDNNTVRGWFEAEATADQKERLAGYLGYIPEVAEVHDDLVRLAMMSVCRLVIIPVQDLLGLGEEARMNRPARAEGNWEWRMESGQVTEKLAQKLAELTTIYGRA